MKKNLPNFIYYVLLSSLFLINGACSNPGAEDEAKILDAALNQVGYSRGADKIVLLKVDASDFEIRGNNGKVVFKGIPSEWKSWDLSGDSVRVADFSEVTTPGVYSLWVNDTLLARPINISERPYEALAKASFKSFYFNRSGMAIDSLYGGEWTRSAGHPDTIVYVHSSAADMIRPEGTVISCPGGWYDAGDYGKYIVNSGITTYTLLLNYALNSEYHKAWNAAIPESENEMPDILDEALYNIKWMLTMQDPVDGGVYHKLTTKRFDKFVMPHETYKERYVVKKSTSAALDFAATMAVASRIFAEYKPKLSQKIMESAEKAWLWAVDHPHLLYIQPEDFSTGEYKDTSLIDEWFWAASELYITSGRKSYLEVLQANYTKPTTPKWNVVGTIGIISLLTSDKNKEFEEFQNDFVAYIDGLVEIEKSSAYRVSLNKFAWGSNSDVANQGLLKLIAYHLTKDEKYHKSARNDLDYLLGRNATGYCFVTGAGIKSPQHIHHRPSGADGVDAPVPGFIVGGPNTIVLNDCGRDVIRSKYPAKSYIDAECSYSTNEIAINWNAPLVFLTSGIDAFDNTHY